MMNKLMGRCFPLFLIFGLLTVLVPLAIERKESFDNLFGEFSKWYYQFHFVNQSPESKQEMDAVVHRASRLSKEERVKFFTLLYIKFPPDGEAGQPVRKAIADDELAYFMEHTRKLIDNPDAFISASEMKNLEIFISFLNSIKKVRGLP